jgi:hypothetical protein
MQFENVRSIKVPLNADCRDGYGHFHNSKWKLQNMVNRKNGEIGNILLKHVFTSLC